MALKANRGCALREANVSSAPANPLKEETVLKKSLLVAALLFIACFPSLSPSKRGTVPPPYPIIAVAGHTSQGSYCEDGTPGCISGDLRSANPARKNAASPSQSSGKGLSAVAILVAFELLRWIVLRF
jgi:hypothetical protein